ncbi:flagellar biosynthetic protein FliQ [Thermosyntropha lipolytica DSM 11003]|uniref:Flagellar biosynthetic protein FliQ n=1 Tax=Thermosyntropha lipolytica DSM 11003 TaxID=1123382 RepID=A0A1M5KYE9_9FIRM|nr:flagellar biosynthesis protein FliQ [Thermosyntropha lipolytica]SHG57844.1 flagellar biosynthetic protein FliQ [Thermosyntropha lipolytica DSM 11003]
MYEDVVLSLAHQAVVTVLLVSAPILGAALLTGLIISILQATTQMQEMTLVFVPKIVVVFLVTILFGPWMLNILTSFAHNLWAAIPTLISL